jgi:hypothetical protein
MIHGSIYGFHHRLIVIVNFSIIGEKILPHFHLTHVFASAIKVFKRFSIVVEVVEFKHLTN